MHLVSRYIVKHLFRFWSYVKNLRSLRIFFTENYSESLIPAEVRLQSPLLVNPVNRYQNLLDGLPQEFFEVFVASASNSLARLQVKSGDFFVVLIGSKKPAAPHHPAANGTECLVLSGCHVVSLLQSIASTSLITDFLLLKFFLLSCS